jgi:hypothetical protein
MSDWLVLLCIWAGAVLVADVAMIIMGWTFGRPPDWEMIAVSNVGAGAVFGVAAVLTKVIVGHW